MNILFYSPQTLPSIGGLQYVVHYWAEALSSLGHTITIITDTPETPANESPLRLRASASKNTVAGKNSYQVLRNVSFAQQVRAMRVADKVLLFNVSLKALPAILLSGKPIYITHHTALWYPNGARPLRQRMKQWVANNIAKGNCACSSYIASLYKKCRVIHSPYRADLFFRGKEPRVPGSIVFAGRLVSDKGVDLLIEAFARLLNAAPHTQTGSPPAGELEGASLTIIGDGPERQNLEQLAQKHGLLGDSLAGVSSITFTGSLPQSDLVRQLQTHELMVVPSRMEPMGMVVAEGLASGCRMVVSNQGGLPEVGGAFCRYFESGNVEYLVEALRGQLLQPLPVAADSLQKHLEKFTIEYTARQLEEWLTG